MNLHDRKLKNLKLSEFTSSQKAEFILKSYDHELRQDILRYLRQFPGSNVTAILIGLSRMYGRYIQQSVLSQNLAILRKSNLVEFERQGKKIFYSEIRNNVNAVKQFKLHVEKGVEKLQFV